MPRLAISPWGTAASLLARPWLLVMLVGLPVWLAAAMFRILGMFVVSQDLPTDAFFVLSTPPRVIQHLLLAPLVLVALRLALELGWPAGHRLRTAFAHLVLAFVVNAPGRPLLMAIGSLFHPDSPADYWVLVEDPGPRLWISSTLDLSLAYLLGLAAMAFARVSLALHDSELEQRRLHEAWTETRLQALRMQLNPHFLFNAFNLAATQLDRDPENARSVLLSLSKLFRRTLATMDDPWATISAELDFAREYLNVQARRFGSRLSFVIVADSSVSAMRVPAMLLQPLLENAIAHGTDDDLNNLYIAIQVAAVTSGDTISIEIENRTDGSMMPASDGAGSGLTITEDRLRVCYGDRASLLYRRISESTYRVTVVVPTNAGSDGDRAVPIGDG